MLRHEIRTFMRDIDIEGAQWEARVAKLQEELGELDEALNSPSAEIDEVMKEYADVGIVALTIAEKARMQVERLGFNFDALMVCKMDEVRRR